MLKEKDMKFIITALIIIFALTGCGKTSHEEKPMEKPLQISAGKLTLWPGDNKSKTDGLMATGWFSYLGETVVWIKHADMEDHRWPLRVPEGVHWKGKISYKLGVTTSIKEITKKTKVERPPKVYYQCGQVWQRAEGKLFYKDCPIHYTEGPSPGFISATVEVLKPDLIQVSFTIKNTTKDSLEEVSASFCFNHRRAPLMGHQIFAQANDEWVDFNPYYLQGPYRKFLFNQDAVIDSGLAPITMPALFSETIHDQGMFGTVIASPDAASIMSNEDWPCTDLTLDFGTIAAGEASTKKLYLGLGLGGKERWLKEVKPLINSQEPAE
jgi:hypothetical protein